MPPPIRALTAEMLQKPAVLERARTTVTPAAIAQAVYPVAQELKSALLIALLKRGDVRQALVFTRTKHRANRLADALVRDGVRAGRIHGNRSQAQRTAALDAFRAGTCPVLVATDIAARGIDVEDLAHVVNFDVPIVPDDYIHRVGRTGRAEATGEALTFMAPDERGALTAIERAIGRPLPRVTLPDFDYAARPAGRLEIPLAERLAAMRADKAQARARSEAKRQRHPARPGGAGPRGTGEGAGHSRRGPGGPGSGSGPGRGSFARPPASGSSRPGSPATPPRDASAGAGPSTPNRPGRWRFRPRRRR
jgi:ATP-dependent RNA helicase RhlE